MRGMGSCEATMELKNIIEILIIAAFVVFLIIRGGENKRIVSKKKIDECMHFYLNTIGLRLDDHMMNEYLTDVSTVYMGFYNIIEKGYFRHGYLTTNNLKYVRNKISNPRNNIVEFMGR